MSSSEDTRSQEDALLLEEIETQMVEQGQALDEINGLLKDDADNEELLQMREDITSSIRDLEQYFASTSGEKAAVADMAGQRFRFRHTDGCWYHGTAGQRNTEGTHVYVYYSRPTKTHQLEGLWVDLKHLRPSSDSSKGKHFDPGSRVIVQPREGGLWEAAEVEFVDESGQATVVLSGTGHRTSLPLSSLAESAFATDSNEGSEDVSVVAEGVTSDSEADSADDLQDGRRLSGWAASNSVVTRVAGGTQQETATFGHWEEHTRGIGSKLMVGMGYVKGASLGPRKGGLLDPIQVQLLRPGAGLGSKKAQLGNVEGTSSKKRRGGKQARRKRYIQAARAEREARKQEEWEDEQEMGTPGMFAFINRRLGDGSEAAAVIKRTSGQPTSNSASNGAFGMNSQPQEPAAAGNRQSLAAGQDGLQLARQKVAMLQAMAERNRKDPVIGKQVARKLAEAKAELDAAEATQAKSAANLHSREKQKKWLKF